jgi:hypothetical protein
MIAVSIEIAVDNHSMQIEGAAIYVTALIIGTKMKLFRVWIVPVTPTALRAL